MSSLTKSTRARLIKDIKEIMSYSKDNKNIFYKHSEENLLNGYALIIGDATSPYRYGNYLFKFKFPEDYPFSPPKVKFLTNDGVIRYHPNLYKNGTCCLSILNTWKGDQWTSCQTILSVLLSISSIFQNNSLILEPGVRLHHPDVEKYNRIIEYTNLKFCVFKIIQTGFSMLDNSYYKKTELIYVIDMFKEEIVDTFKTNCKDIISWINANKIMDKRKISTSMYHLTVILNYEEVENSISFLKTHI